MSPFNVAVIGYGLSAKVFHIPLIQAIPESFTLYGIVQRSPKPGDDASKDHPQLSKTWHNTDDMLLDPEVDVVIVTSIPSAHFSHVKSALEAGKHVVVEKPFVPTAAEAHTLIALAKKAGKLLSVYQNRRWDVDYLTLKELLASGRLGDVAEFETHFDKFAPQTRTKPSSWKGREDLSGGGALFNLGSHLLDQVYTLFGAPASVTAIVGIQERRVSGTPPDAFTLLLQYENEGGNMLVTAKASVISPMQEQLRYWVRGSKGSYKKCFFDPQEDQIRLHGMKLNDEGFGVEPESHLGRACPFSMIARLD